MARLSPPPPADGALRARGGGSPLPEGAKKAKARTSRFPLFSYNLLHFQLAAAGVHADAEHNADAEIHHDDA